MKFRRMRQVVRNENQAQPAKGQAKRRIPDGGKERVLRFWWLKNLSQETQNNVGQHCG